MCIKGYLLKLYKLLLLIKETYFQVLSRIYFFNSVHHYNSWSAYEFKFYKSVYINSEPLWCLVAICPQQKHQPLLTGTRKSNTSKTFRNWICTVVLFVSMCGSAQSDTQIAPPIASSSHDTSELYTHIAREELWRWDTLSLIPACSGPFVLSDQHYRPVSLAVPNLTRCLQAFPWF